MSLATNLCRKIKTSMVPQANAKVARREMRQAALCKIGLTVFEDIAHTPQRANQRLLPLAIDLAAQSIDVNIHNVRVWLDAHAPDLIENHGTSDNSARVAAEILQQNKFLRRELQDLPGPSCLAAKQVQLKIEDAQAGRFACRGAIAFQQVAQASQQFGKREGLRQIIVSALFQAANPVIDASPRR